MPHGKVDKPIWGFMLSVMYLDNGINVNTYASAW